MKDNACRYKTVLIKNQQLMLDYIPRQYPQACLSGQGSNPGVAGAFIAPSNPERSLTALISKRPAMTLEQLVQETMASHPQAPLTCFREVVAGSGSLQATMQRTRSLPFRSSSIQFRHETCVEMALVTRKLICTLYVFDCPITCVSNMWMPKFFAGM